MTADYQISHSTEEAIIRFSGEWTMQSSPPTFNTLVKQLGSKPQRLSFDASQLQNWDALWVSRLYQCYLWCQQQNITFAPDKLPEEARKLLQIACAVSPKQQATQSEQGWLASFDCRPWLKQLLETLRGQLTFIGEVTQAGMRMLIGKADTRWHDCLYFFEQAGPKAIGIVTLISVLVGMILAYLGAVQLALFGAEVYVANLVTVGMVREMGALMTAIIMAGRTGAAYAAQLGTMQTNEEIDAVTTLGISPIEFLVMPRMLALIAVMPLLCIYADVLGILGGAFVAMGMDITLIQFISQAQSAASLNSIFVGIGKSIVFGLIIAIAGCKAGINSGRSSAAVGNATTKAVVSAIVWLVVADAIINIILSHLKI